MGTEILTETHMLDAPSLAAQVANNNVYLDPDVIRTAIDAVDERARLLRRLLRIALRLQLNLTTGDRLIAPAASHVKAGKAVRP